MTSVKSELPEFGGKEASKAVVLVYAGQSGFSEGGRMVGEPDGAKAGKDAKDEVKGADEYERWKTHATGWDAEIGEEPESLWRKGGGNTCKEDFKFGLGKAIDEEVSNDEVVDLRALRCKGEGVGVVSSEAV
jgi:hypothetical protein